MPGPSIGQALWVPQLVNPLINSSDSQCVLGAVVCWLVGPTVDLSLVGPSVSQYLPRSVSPKDGLSLGWLTNQFLSPDQFFRLLVSPFVHQLLVWSLSWQVLQ